MTTGCESRSPHAGVLQERRTAAVVSPEHLRQYGVGRSMAVRDCFEYLACGQKASPVPRREEIGELLIIRHDFNLWGSGAPHALM